MKRAIALAALALQPSCGERELPARLVNADPPDGANTVPVGLGEIVLTFDAPAQGEFVTLRVADATYELAVSWDASSTRAAVPVAGVLRNDVLVQLELTQLQSASGEPLSLAEVLDDGLLDFVVGDAPVVISSSPGDGDDPVYPTPATSMVDIQIEFSEPMNPSAGSMLVEGDDGSELSPPLTWSDDSLRVTARLLGNAATGGRVLADDTAYGVTLEGFTDAVGNSFVQEEPLRFRTGEADPLLDHACGHVSFGPFDAVAASVDPDAAPYADVGHVSYDVALPPAGPTHVGHTKFRTKSGEHYDLFLDRAVDASVVDPTGTTLVFSATPPACDGISHRIAFEGTESADLIFSFESDTASFGMIVEVTQ